MSGRRACGFAVVLLALAAQGPASAQGFPSGARISIPTGNLPYALVIGDFDEDGRPDMATANFGAGTVSVFLAGGGQGFAARRDFADAGAPGAIAAADVNGDGHLDLLTADYYAGSVSVLLGDGHGNFGSRSSFPVGPNPTALAIGDLDGDGRLDLAVTELGSNSVAVLIGDGHGGFGPQTDFAVGLFPYAVAIGDLDGDGLSDLAVANAGAASLTLLVGDGAGGFTTAATLATGSTPSSIALGDFDGDGALDLAVACGGSRAVTLYRGDGFGGFTRLSDLAAGADPVWVSVGDLDADGRTDLVVADAQSNSVLLFMGRGGSAFSAPGVLISGTRPYGAAVADFDGDGNPDVVSVNAFSSSVVVTFGNAVTDYSVSFTFTTGPSPTSLVLADLNHDGHLDALTSDLPNAFSTLLGDGSGGFGGETRRPCGLGAVALAAGDLNGDGHPDVAVCNTFDNTVSVFLGDGSGGFGARTNWPTGVAPEAVAIGDVNGDGHADLVVANYIDSDVQVMLGDGAGGFPATVTLATGLHPQSVTLVQLAGDANLDIVTANDGAASVSVIRDDGAGGFLPRTDYGTGGLPPVAIAAADLNGDGRPDLVAGCSVVSGAPGAAVVLLANGAGGFTTQSSYTPLDAPTTTLALADVDDDGHIDIVVPGGPFVYPYNDQSPQLTILAGAGDGTFTARPSIALDAACRGPAVADLNGDGRQDLVVAIVTASGGQIVVKPGLAATRTRLAISPASAPLGAPLQLTATVAAAIGPAIPEGSVRFVAGDMTLGMAPLSDGVATLTLPRPLLRLRSLSAVYPTTGPFRGSWSNPVVASVVTTDAPLVSRLSAGPFPGGGALAMSFTRSRHDHPGSATPILAYTVLRRGPAGGWDSLLTVMPTAAGAYRATVPTLADSGCQGINRTSVLVRAAAPPGTFFDSAPDSGCSVDSIPPPAPTGLTRLYGGGIMSLHWNPSPDPGFYQFVLYAGTTPDFVPGPGNRLAATMDTLFLDGPETDRYYALEVEDRSCNASGFARAGPDALNGVAGPRGDLLTLTPIRPNPTRANRLRVSFTLPASGDARLDVLDVGGRRIATRSFASLAAGPHEAEIAPDLRWPAGLYFVRLSFAGESRVRRLLVVR